MLHLLNAGQSNCIFTRLTSRAPLQDILLFLHFENESNLMLLPLLSVVLLSMPGNPVLLKAQHVDYNTSVSLDTVQNSTTIYADINIPTTLTTRNDTLEFHLPFYAYAQSNTILIPENLIQVLEKNARKEISHPTSLDQSTANISDTSITSIIDKNNTIDPQPETNHLNHYVNDTTSDKTCFRFSSLFHKDKSSCNTIKLIAFPAYNDNDGWMAGMTVSNTNPFTYKPISWAISPIYSFKNQKLLGQAWIQYSKLNERSESKIYQTSFRLGLKSFDMDHNEKFNYALRYVKIDPSIQLTLRHPLDSDIQSSFVLRSLIIYEQRPSFADGQFSNLITSRSHIHQLEYNWERNKTISKSTVNIRAEQQSYKPENYLKLTGSASHQWLYNTTKSMNLRLFVGGFIINTQRKTNSFQNVFSRGSIALIQQGFNDYTYDEYFFSRQNQSGFQDDQVSLVQGGGFKTPVGSAYSIGMSNNFAAALNYTIDAPFKTKWFPLQAYFDFGVYSRYFNRQFSRNTMYNGGLSLNYNDVVRIHFPLFFSEELGNIYKEKHSGFISKISFGINLQKLNFWQNHPLKIIQSIP